MWGSGAVWDPDKARRNVAKHGVSFEDAQSVLHDPFQLVEPDEAHSFGQDRLRVTGSTSGGRVLVLIVVFDLGGTIRLISARRPTRRERHDYEGTRR